MRYGVQPSGKNTFRISPIITITIITITIITITIIIIIIIKETSWYHI